jgi:DNA-binding LytR/AlgR family response regulator
MKMKKEKAIRIGGHMKAFPSEIIMLQAEINYTKLFFNNGKLKVVAMTLRELESRLAPFDFIRTHKSFLINLNHLSENQPIDPCRISMQNGLEVSISRRRRLALSKEIQLQKGE